MGESKVWTLFMAAARMLEGPITKQLSRVSYWPIDVAIGTLTVPRWKNGQTKQIICTQYPSRTLSLLGFRELRSEQGNQFSLCFCQPLYV